MSGNDLESGFALQYIKRGIKPVRIRQMTRKPYFPMGVLFGQEMYVDRILPIRSQTLNNKTTATGVKNFLDHCELDMDWTVEVTAGNIIRVVE